MTPGTETLTSRQRALLDAWLPGARVEHDHSWGLTEITVLEVLHGDERFVVKAGGPGDHHVAREIHAHLHWLAPWTSIGRAPVLRHHDTAARILVTRYLPGVLVLDTPYDREPETYRQAGRLLALLHGQPARTDDTYEAAQNRRTLAWLERPHRIAPDTVRELRELISSWPTPPAALVPTHGDWQPRNWLVHDGVVAAIDLGRSALRPAMSDLGRLVAQQFRTDPGLEEAFLDGYGADPRAEPAWYRHRVREAVGTAAWARQVGDETFEAQGHRMIADALAEASRHR